MDPAKRGFGLTALLGGPSQEAGGLTALLGGPSQEADGLTIAVYLLDNWTLSVHDSVTLENVSDFRSVSVLLF